MQTIKTILLLITVVLSGICTHATHITGGELSYDYLGNDLYNIRLKVYRDCGPNNVNGTGFDEPCYIGIYYGNGGGLHSVQQISLSNSTVTVLPFGVTNPCLVVPPDVCIEEAVYQVQVTLTPEPLGYDLVYQRCCRSPQIINLNLPQDQGMTCSTHIPGNQQLAGTNSSATFINLPPALMCTGEIFSMDHSASDADADSLYYYLCQPYLGGQPAEPQPVTPLGPPYNEVSWFPGFDTNYPISSSPAFTINPITGYFFGQPTAPGSYVFAICVDEFRDGVLINTVRRDYMIQVVLCGQTIVSAIAPQPDPCIGYTISFQNWSNGGTVYNWDFGVEGTDADTSVLQNPTFTFPEYGTYNVTLVAQPGAVCADTAYVEVQINPEDPLVMSYTYTGPAPCDTSRIFTFDFTGENADAIDWDYGEGNTASGAAVEHQYEVNGTYNLQLAIYNDLCQTTDTAWFSVSTDESILNLPIIMPTVFTPNSDNLNTELRPFSPLESAVLPAGKSLYDYIDVLHMKVYNRWGNLVYDAGQTMRGWDGKYNSETAKGDTFYYIVSCSLLCSDKVWEFDGHVTLLE